MPTDTPAISSDAVRSLAWSAAVERRSASLPHRSAAARRRGRDFVHDDRVAVVASLDTADEFPGSGIFVNPETGVSMLARPYGSPVSSPAAADVTVASGMRTAAQLRFRSFYMSGTSARSLAVHQRLSPGSRTPLAKGAQFQREIRGRIPFVVPRVIETGLTRVGTGRGVFKRAAVDWLVEEALDGSLVSTGAAEGTASEMLDMFAESWRTLGVDHAPVAPDEQALALAAFDDLAQNPPPDMWPADVDRDQTRRHVENLLASTRPMTMGFSHGDPGIGNVLRLADQRLALIDWEYAGYRLIAHDALKVVMSTPNPPAFAATLDTPAELHAALSSATASAWPRQIAVALLLFLSGWRKRYDNALKLGGERANIKRMHALLRTLNALADQ